MSVDAATVHEFFRAYGWRYDFDDSTSTWRTGFRGDSGNFNIFVHLTENWLYFTICPFVNAPVEPECEKNLHRHLLRLNNTINMAKFGIDQDGDVILTVELPTENLDYSEFADGLNALSYYADAHYLDVLNVALKPEYEAKLGRAPEGENPGGEEGGEGGAWGAN